VGHRPPCRGHLGEWGLGSEQVWWEGVILLTWLSTTSPTSLSLLYTLLSLFLTFLETHK